eukprot:10655726-Heterocapsa_arctica.AAC.1
MPFATFSGSRSLPVASSNHGGPVIDARLISSTALAGLLTPMRLRAFRAAPSAVGSELRFSPVIAISSSSSSSVTSSSSR